MIFYFVLQQEAFFSLFYSLPSLIVFGTLTETIWGTTLGKKIFRIKVIDDCGNHPKILKSLCRNLLCLATFKLIFNDYIPPLDEALKIEHKETNFTIHMNNKLCKTYIIKEAQFEEIKKLLEQKK